MADETNLITEVRDRVLERIDLSDKLTDQKLTAVAEQSRRDIQDLRDDHTRDKAEAITRSTNEHKNTREAVSLVGGRVTVLEKALEDDVKPVVAWYHTEGVNLGGRVSTLEQLNVKAQAEKAEAEEGRKLIAAEQRGWWKAWGRITALGSALAGLIGLLLGNLDAVIEIIKHFFSRDGGEVKPKTAAAAGGALMLALGLVAVFEGTKTHSYLDVVGIPTICTGHTGAEVQLGQTATADVCRDLLAKDMAWAFAVEDKALTDPTKIPAWTRAAMASFIYNIGGPAWLSSPMPQLLNLGKYDAACKAMLPYVNARIGGNLVPVNGLIRRRVAEYNLCMGNEWSSQ